MAFPALLLAGALLAASTPQAPPDTIPASLDSLIAAEFAPYASGGVVLIARRGAPIFRRAYGAADLELDVPMRPEHVFRVGSITKQFTAFAILRLAQQGRLRLDDDVRAHVPEFASHGHRVTIEHLLVHTSGTPSLVDLDDFEKLARQELTVAQLLALTKDIPFPFVPGASFRYSDTGYILLGAVIERVSGMSYAAYIEREFAGPLGLRSTRYATDSTIVPLRAKGYTMHDGELRNAPYISMTVPHAAGGISSTVDDLLRWQVAMRGGRIVPPDVVAKAWQGRVLPDGAESGYGFGVKACAIAGRRSIGHGGFINGFSSTALQLPDDNIDVIVLVNNDADAPDAGRVARRIARVMLGGAPVPRYMVLTAPQRRALAGAYEIVPGDVREIVDSAGTLFSRRNRGAMLPWVALSPFELTLEESEGAYVMRFETDADGRVSGVRTFLNCEPGSAAERVRDAGPGDSSQPSRRDRGVASATSQVHKTARYMSA